MSIYDKDSVDNYPITCYKILCKHCQVQKTSYNINLKEISSGSLISFSHSIFLFLILEHNLLQLLGLVSWPMAIASTPRGNIIESL